jgi:hypothetical protein
MRLVSSILHISKKIPLSNLEVVKEKDQNVIKRKITENSPENARELPYSVVGATRALSVNGKCTVCEWKINNY